MGFEGRSLILPSSIVEEKVISNNDKVSMEELEVKFEF